MQSSTMHHEYLFLLSPSECRANRAALTIGCCGSGQWLSAERREAPDIRAESAGGATEFTGCACQSLDLDCRVDTIPTAVPRVLREDKACRALKIRARHAAARVDLRLANLLLDLY